MKWFPRSLNRRPPSPAVRSPGPAAPGTGEATHFHEPRYSTRWISDALRLAIRLPGVSPDDIDIQVDGPDIVVTAAAENPAARPPASGRSPARTGGYHLRLRLGFCFDYAALRTDRRAGNLTIWIPRKEAVIVASSRR